jgi:cytochrome o ubiquinol oxidase subunit 2
MKTKIKILLLIAIVVVLAVTLAVLLTRDNVAILNPEGDIARQERDLILMTAALGAVIVIPVFAMLFTIAWKYRDDNKEAKYEPDWDHSRVLEGLWWGIPCVIIVILSVIAFYSSHALDPYKPLASKEKPVTVQVVALQWKWLFIYPEEKIASVNFVQFPEDRPVNFQITADAPMNSFWIPKLGGQVYAMNGMSTKLHLIADTVGEYEGSSANISGEGFAGMKFTAKSSSQTDYDTWVSETKQSSNHLDMTEYDKLAVPSKNVPPKNYMLMQSDLYDKIVMKYMAPENKDATKDHEHMNHEEMQ